jgi:hypothetical protein
MKIAELKSNPNNPRLIKDDKFKKLCTSIEQFPKMMELRPIIIDENNIILGGNMRFNALKHLGYKELPSEWVKQASELTEEQKQEFIVKDNVGFGEWDWDILANEWEAEKLAEWAVPSAVFNDNKDYFEVDKKGTQGNDAPSATSDTHSTFELIMLHENKLLLLEALNKIKSAFLFEKQEEAIMELVRIYDNQ